VTASPGTRPAGPERRRLLDALSRPPEEAARLLLGTVLVRRLEDGIRAARIVETEAYLGTDDPAAHAFRGRTARTAPLWGKPGTVYVYFIYGMHHCLNFAVERKGTAGCVLVRAAEPLAGLDPGAATGPGRLCRAMAIDTRLSGRHLFEAGSRLYLREGRAPRRIGVSTRVGIRQAADRPLRFFDADSPAVTPHRGVVTYSRIPARR
jgi:DNA-3-methyladenine glycosylase